MKATILIAASMLVMNSTVEVEGAGKFSLIFTDVELKSQYGSLAPKTDGILIVDKDQIQFKKEIGKGSFEILTCSVKALFYTRVSARRLIETSLVTGGSFVGIAVAAAKEASAAIKIATGIAGLIGSVIASAERGHKHYMVLVFDQVQDGEHQAGAVEFKLDKKKLSKLSSSHRAGYW